MRNRILVLILAVVAALAFSHALFAQAAKPPAKPPAASSIPDFSGVWMEREATRTFNPKGEPPMQPAALAKFKAVKPDSDPVLDCFPPGVPRILLFSRPLEILQIPGRVVIFHEYGHFVRQIFTDGREHPQGEDLDLTWMGHSIGKWDKDTLVVDTVGQNDMTWLDHAGHPHSDALHVVERIRRVDHDTLADILTIDDPKAYTKPWTGQKIFKLRPGREIVVHSCEDDRKAWPPAK